MLPLGWWVIFVDIRSSISGLDRVVVELFFARGIGVPEADQGKKMVNLWNNIDSYGLTVR